MPRRALFFVTDEVYHICNRGIDKRPTFMAKKEYERAITCLWYYSFLSPPIKLSRFLTLQDDLKNEALKNILSSAKLADIICFCFMPNHFHFLLQQKVDGGISQMLSQFQNSYTRYFNTKHERIGPLFLDQFKGVRIEDSEQLVHVCRYIHLNPYTSYVVKTFDQLFSYPWSSLPEYLGKTNSKICAKEIILEEFKNFEIFKKFITDQGDYQRQLDRIKHLMLDD